MEITKTNAQGALTYALKGRLDTLTAPDLERTLKEDLPSAETLTFDCAQLEYVSSAGLRVLLAAHKKMLSRKGMVVRNVNEMVREVLELTGLADVLTIE